MKITLAWGKKNDNIRTSISAFYHHFFHSHLSCKLQLIVFITVFAAFLVGRQTSLVSFFPENAGTEKRQTDGKIKVQLDVTDTPLTFCPKNAIEE